MRYGAEELEHPETDFFVVGMKSNGRAPTFLLRTGYEQLRAVVLVLTGEWEAARRVELVPPETGVCSSNRDGADCLGAARHGKQPQTFNFAYAGQGIALGRHDAIGFNNYPADHANPPYLPGAIGFQTREIFVRLLADRPSIERRWPDVFIALGRGRHAAAQRRR